MTKTTNILRCTLTPSLCSEFTSDLADIELNMLCSDKIAAAARKLKQQKDVYKLDDRDNRKLREYVRDSCSLNSKIVKAFKQQTEFDIGDLHLNPDSLPSATRTRLERIRDGFREDLPPDFLWIC
jgi:hypothetical protein